jgi:para-nitrobenzyl esterase
VAERAISGSRDLVVAVRGGDVRGVVEGDVIVFRGIPYARAPRGELRWRPPEPPEPWTGIRDAVAFGPIAPQEPPVPGMSVPGDPTASDEDCLRVHIFTPGLDDRRRPVMVFVHGGGFTSGSGASRLYDGRRLAGRHDVVVVTFNYRLGALGFLAHPALASGEGEGFANWGLLDQLALLAWVHDHAAAFGGDPESVTLFGESAGAMSIATLLATGRTEGLVHRAVLQSGPPLTMGPGLASARAERLCELARLGSVDRARLVEVETERLVEATGALGREVLAAGDTVVLPLLPTVDGGLISEPSAVSFEHGRAHRVPLLVGTTRDETAFFSLGDERLGPLDHEGLERRVARFVGHDVAPALVEAYRQARSARGEDCSPRALWVALSSDYVFRLPTLALASAQVRHDGKAYAYLFTWESPLFAGNLGACHAIDLPFVFGTLEDPAIGPFVGSGPQALRLKDAVQAAWAAFARDGDPSCDELGSWEAFEPERRATMVLGARPHLESDPYGIERRAWSELGVALGPGHHFEVEASGARRHGIAASAAPFGAQGGSPGRVHSVGPAATSTGGGVAQSAEAGRLNRPQ